MSELYFGLALAGTFAAVLLAAVSVQAVVSSRRRTIDLMRSQVPIVRTTDLREQELAQPFAERVMAPVASTLGNFAKRVTPIGMRERIARQLVLGGNQGTLDAEKVAAMKIFATLGGVIMGVAVAVALGVKGIWPIVLPAFIGCFGYLLPGAGLGQRAINRQEAIRKALPDTMDLLTISVEAGLGFDAALAHVRRNVPGALSDEIGRMLQEMQIGVSRADALRHLSERSDIDELKAFALAMVQADVFGVSIAKVLRAQSKELRLRRRQRAEEAAMKVPVKLLFPMILGILPSMFVVIVGPGVIKIAQTFFGG